MSVPAVKTLGATVGTPSHQSTPFGDALYQFRKNKAGVAGLAFIVFLVLVVLLADNSVLVAVPNLLGAHLEVKPLLAREVFDKTHFKDSNKDPSAQYPLGADYLGRDIYSRVVYGARISLSVALIAAIVSLIVGVIYGLISGYLGGWVDNLMMRVVDYLYGFPALILIILIQVYFKALDRRGAGGVVGQLLSLNAAFGGLLFLFIVIGLFNWLGMARITRGQVLSIKKSEYIEAAQCIGASDARIIFRHLMPNILGPCIVAVSLQIPNFIFTEAFLSYLGLGVQSPLPSWGIMVSETVLAIRSHPLLLLGPGLALTLTTLAFNFFGDGLRDALDPRTRGS